MDPKDRLPAEWPDFDPRAMLRALNSGGVDYVVIGGIAVIAQGYIRTTRDLDIAFDGETANLEALGRVLTDLDARLRGVDDDIPFAADARTLAGIQLLTLETSLGWLDVHKVVPGISRYDDLRRRAVSTTFEGVRVRIASIDDLLAMKTAAGRDLDRTDIAALRAIKRRS
jgi:hypothetical protein